ncbi:MAG: PQQ-binding-like beta-propeller repeat protein, partial [Pirellulaceae bacterium]|nr:PQQ-binding-like beta-propeller repeat protein [Pirellulaceae bacterium]
MNRPGLLLLFVLACPLTARLWAGDWPQFRYDAGRTAASPDQLPDQLQLLWTRTLPAPRPAFPYELRLGYDAAYEPVVMGQTMFVPSMVTDSVTALDTATGVARWRFFAEGPVRFAPVAWDGKVYFVSDDGHLYCLNASDGSLRWRFRGLPAGQRNRGVIGHGRLVSLWPARGGPVLAEDVVYFAAGLWPSEGVFVHAVDARSGEAVWSNTDSHAIPASNWDHGIGHVAGLTPQGYLAIVGDRLVVPCGAQLPAFLELRTGKLQTYTMGWGGRLGLPKGCWFVAGVGKYLSHGGDLFDITRPSDERLAGTKAGQSDYKSLLYPGGFTRLDIERANQRELDRFRQPVLTPDVMYESDQSLVARDLTAYTLRKWTSDNIPPHRAKDEVPDQFGAEFRQLWEIPSTLQLHLKAGSRLYVGGPGVVEAIDTAGPEPRVVWRQPIEGTPARMLAADEKLFIVTTEGTILALGAAPAAEVAQHVESISPPAAADKWTGQAEQILNATGVRDGFALVLGLDSGRLIEELVRQSDLHVIAVDNDDRQAAAVRQRLLELGLYGTRASVLVGDPADYPFSPYLASLIVSETPAEFAAALSRASWQPVFQTLRPYGGVACIWGLPADPSDVAQVVRDERLPGANVRTAGNLVLLSREGALPGAADWSHAEANAACTGASEDEFIRPPLAVLWFDAAQRWHKYPGQVQVRVAGGRVVIFEEGVLLASDVYTGRKLWEVEVPFGAKPLDDPSDRDRVRYARHRQWGPGAALPSTAELVATAEAIYLSAGPTCLVFQAATGKLRGQMDLPDGLDKPWSNLRVTGDVLLGNSGNHVLCVQPSTGKLLWRVEAERNELSLAVGADKLFCAELADPRRGEDERRDGSTFALNIATGERVWRNAGGARLRYSASLDMLVTSTGFYRGIDGRPLPPPFEPPAAGLAIKGRGLPAPSVPGYIAGNRLLTGDEQNLLMFDLLSGKQLGDSLGWVRRGCTGTRASTHLLTTRYRANSAWIDLDSREITPLLGVRPGCSVNNNLYPANGVLNIPNLTAGCTCN